MTEKLIKGAQLTDSDTVGCAELLIYVMPINGCEYTVKVESRVGPEPYPVGVDVSHELAADLGLLPGDFTMYVRRDHLYRTIRPEPMTEIEAMEYLQERKAAFNWMPNEGNWQVSVLRRRNGVLSCKVSTSKTLAEIAAAVQAEAE